MKRFNLKPVVTTLLPNGYVEALVLKRDLTLREVRYVMDKIFGVVLNTRKDCYDKEDWDDYNKDLVETFNGWLRGKYDETALMEFEGDCSDEPYRLIDMIPLVAYLQKKGII